MTTPEEPRSAEQLAAERTSMASGRTDMAAMRTLMSADRTLMAWVRTSLSLLSFSFTIYQILEQLPRFADRLPGNTNARNAGLFLAALGTIRHGDGHGGLLADAQTDAAAAALQSHAPRARHGAPDVAMGLALFVSISTGFL